MNDDWVTAGTITDASGKTITVEHAGGLVRITVRPPVKGSA